MASGGDDARDRHRDKRHAYVELEKGARGWVDRSTGDVFVGTDLQSCIRFTAEEFDRLARFVHREQRFRKK